MNSEEAHVHKAQRGQYHELTDRITQAVNKVQDIVALRPIMTHDQFYARFAKEFLNIHGEYLYKERIGTVDYHLHSDIAGAIGRFSPAYIYLMMPGYSAYSTMQDPSSVMLSMVLSDHVDLPRHGEGKPCNRKADNIYFSRPVNNIEITYYPKNRLNDRIVFDRKYTSDNYSATLKLNILPKP